MTSKMKLKLPMGIENFESIRKDGFYYVDKTGLIKELLDNWGLVNLFTRPRRFGKTLNMSMLRYFFEYGCDAALFQGLEIAGESELCKEYMGKYPVISISLKGVMGRTYDEAFGMMRSAIGNEALRFAFLAESEQLNIEEKKQYHGLIATENGHFAMNLEVLSASMKVLTKLLHKHYGQKVIVLIDEYDVPLDKAHQNGYYDDIVNLIRNMFGQALKTNDDLKFAVLTGCLRISKESIFTGLNNFKVLSITNVQFDEHFGFSEAEVQRLLEYYGLEAHADIVKTWYDGYRFGDVDVYCPWDVINYADTARFDPNAEPQAYWINSSGNVIIRNFLQMATMRTMREIEQLINGATISKKISQELTYKELYDNIENIWSVMFTTGYLTSRGSMSGGYIQLAIPNQEIRQIFVDQIQSWFEQKTRKDTPTLDSFCLAFQQENQEHIELQLNKYLSQTIGIHDYSVRKELKENYYHGLLTGLLKHREDWDVFSNAESGEGYTDICVESSDGAYGMVIEVKYADDGNLDAACVDALKQIEDKKYAERLVGDGMERIMKYGVAFYKKSCKVVMGE